MTNFLTVRGMKKRPVVGELRQTIYFTQAYREYAVILSLIEIEIFILCDSCMLSIYYDFYIGSRSI